MTKEYWHYETETMPAAHIEALQLRRLRHLVEYCYRNSGFIRRRFVQSEVEPGDIGSLDDLRKIPFTTKDDLRENYPFGMVAADLADLVETHASSGTTGDPTIAVYTKNDVDVWADLMARCLYSAGGRKGDLIQIAHSYGLFTGGLGFHYGAERIGMNIIPASGGMTRRQIKLMQDLGTTMLGCTPSFAANLAETMVKERIDPRDLNLRTGVFGAEPWSEAMRDRVEEGLGIEAYDIYGLTELCGPGVSIECECHNGLHIWGDHFIVEIIDPDTLEAVSPGEKGELVFTTLTKTGLPLLRYRTRDISILEVDKCSCGRTHPRMMRVLGRSDDALKVRGVNVFPSQIEYVLMRFQELAPCYQVVVDRPSALDELAVKIELSEKAAKHAIVDVDELKNQIEKELRNVLSLKTVVEFVKPGELPRSDGKAKRVSDLRKENM